MPAEPLIEWPGPIFEFLEFITAFLAAGAIGYRYAVIGGMRRQGNAVAGTDAFEVSTLRRAALFGLAGAIYGLYHVASGVPRVAARESMTIAATLMHFSPASVGFWLSTLAVFGLAVAALGRRWGWTLAAAGIVVGSLRGAFFGRWEPFAKAMHVLGGGMWVGTLFIIVVAALPVVLSAKTHSESRGPIVAKIVGAFSPFALMAAGLLGTCGIILAWLKLQPLSLLYTTPYGFALITKLAVVSTVVGLGAWNWKRQKPRLGSETAALSLRRSATAEVAMAGLVIAITAILVSLPDPGPH